jgi:hypothetical protein
MYAKKNLVFIAQESSSRKTMSAVNLIDSHFRLAEQWHFLKAITTTTPSVPMSKTY